MAGNSRIAVVVGKNASELERFAAHELCGCLGTLFGLSAGVQTSAPPESSAFFILGGPHSNPVLTDASARELFPKLSEQGIVLRRFQYQNRPALLVGGGSPRAALWAVYELAERWGARYLLHGDALPKRKEFSLPDLDLVMEPSLSVRQWRTVNAFAMGPESWGISDYRPVLDQLAKLKFSRILVNTWVWQPFVDLQFKGIKRRQAWLFFNHHFPITDDMIGRELFDDVEEFWNPDLPYKASYEELVAAAQTHLHSLMGHAHGRGMECVLTVHVTEFPLEFAPLVKGAKTVRQLGALTVAPDEDTSADDPALGELAAAVVRQTIETYPEADYLQLGMLEWRQWAPQYERAWRALNARYGVEKVRPLADVLDAAQKRTQYPGGAERAVQEAKSDIVSLYFYDRLLNDLKALKGTGREDVKLVYADVAEELFPIMARILPSGSETLNFVDYTPSRVVRRREVLRDFPARELPSVLIYTLHDDNVGVLPQLSTGSLHELTQDLRRYGWAGFSTRYWLIGDHDPCLAYLARAAWDESASPQAIYRDQIDVVCGPGAVEDMLKVFSEVETATVLLEWHGLGLAFPVPGMIMQHWGPKPLEVELQEVCRSYERALEAARRAIQKSSEAGISYISYWMGRLEFGITYLAMVEAVRNAAIAEAGAKPSEALKHAQAALSLCIKALKAYARVARDQSDRGAIATMNEFVYRPLKVKVAELEDKLIH